MHLCKVDTKNYTVKFDNGDEKKLVLTVSVAFFNSKIFPRYLKWKVQDDQEMLKVLFSKALTGCQTSIEGLLCFEGYYSELNGNPREGASEAEKKLVFQRKDEAERDLYNNSLQEDLFFEAETCPVLEKKLSLQPTIGEIAEAKKRLNGANRNAWRTKKKPSRR